MHASKITIARSVKDVTKAEMQQLLIKDDIFS